MSTYQSDEVISILQEAGKPLSAREIAQELASGAGKAFGLINEMKYLGQIAFTADNKYDLPRDAKNEVSNRNETAAPEQAPPLPQAPPLAGAGLYRIGSKNKRGASSIALQIAVMAARSGTTLYVNGDDMPKRTQDTLRFILNGEAFPAGLDPIYVSLPLSMLKVWAESNPRRTVVLDDPRYLSMEAELAELARNCEVQVVLVTREVNQ